MERGGLREESKEDTMDFTSAGLREEEHFKAYWKPVPTRKQRFIAIFFVLLLISFALGLGLYAFLREIQKPTGTRFSFDDIFDPGLKVQRKTVRWIEPDGMSTFRDNGDIYLQQLPSEPKLFVKGSDIIGENGEPLNFFDYWITLDEKFVLLATEREKVWRHSFTAIYYIYTVGTKELKKVTSERTQFAAWSPINSLAYVVSNDIYILQPDFETVIRITNDGSLDIVNGIPAWVYEEEILSTAHAFWWSPDGNKLAFLKSNERDVETFFMTKYGKGLYPSQIPIKYPKPGTTNPTADLLIFDVKGETLVTPDFKFGEESIIVQVDWIDRERVGCRVTNRVQNLARLFSVNASSGDVSLQSFQQSSSGWVDYSTLKFVPGSDLYVELIDHQGYNHIALYRLGSPNPVRMLTEGNWEVTQISSYHHPSRRVFYLSTELDETERHLFSVNIDEGASSRKQLTESPGFYSVSFSTEGGFYLLNYNGPDIPYQKLRSVSDPSYDFTVEDNQPLRERLSTYSLPVRKYVKVPVASNSGFPDYEINCVFILPPDFQEGDPHSYPVLHRVYGGPGSNLVQKTFGLDWHTYLASSEGYMVSMCDGRGTSQKGNLFKHSVYKQLGLFEAYDHVEVAKYIRDLKYTRNDNMLVWGWSYGGYLTSKILETGSGLFVGGIAVAPVTDWLFYDTMYTERYMLTPQENPDGYETSAVRKIDQINGTDYFLIHGTADDNVHMQHTYVLMDELTQGGVMFQVHIYTDNDHAINSGQNTQRDLYHRLSLFLFSHL